jgi:membrane associated rhomboid family serine protease
MKGRKRLLLYFVFAGLLLAVLHYVSLQLGLYWIWKELDVVSHLLGGLVVGLFGRLVLQSFTKEDPKNNTILILTFVLFIGIAWEVFEFYTRTTGVTDPGELAYDTTIDLIMDVVGGYIATKLR